MRIAALIILITLSGGSAKSLVIPGDNSHYVEGQSRYIWMPDGEGLPHLVDLHEAVDYNLLHSKNGNNNQYWLYTRKNPGNPQILVNGDTDSIWNSNYDASLPLKVIVHGWNNDGNSPLNPTITSAFLAGQDVNVIVVDWRALANSNYLTAAKGVVSVGQHLGNFLMWLLWTAGGSWDNVHLIGFSLGAHVVGNAGVAAGGVPARVTGLDPAGPLWTGDPNALSRASGRYVEVIHTDGGLLGLWNPIGDADFYPNGGTNPQPGCWISTCSHGRSHELFASSVLTNHFVASLCVDLTEAQKAHCNGSELHMGNGIISKHGGGIYGLHTGRSWPF